MNPEQCTLHDTLMKTIIRIEEKLDAISDRQVEYIEKTVRIEGIVTNGLSSNVKAMKERLDAFCEKAEARFGELEKFSWFRQWMTGLRDNLFQNILRLVMIGGALYMLIRFGDEFIKGILK